MKREILGAGLVGGLIGGAIVACTPKAAKLKFEEAPHKLLEKFKDDDEDVIEPDVIDPEDLGGENDD